MKAKLLIADSETNADMFWATRFFVPDPFIYLESNGERAIVVSDLELARAQKEARVDKVLSYTEYHRRAKKRRARVGEADIIAEILKGKKIKTLVVPSSFPLETARHLEARGFRLETRGNPFFEERMVKSREEKEAIRHTLACIAHSYDAVTRLLAKARIRGNRILLGGRPLTSEHLRERIDETLYEQGCLATHTIAACGPDAADPHAEGSGPLLPNAPIVLDIFPKHMASGYYGDMTRTLVKGRAPARLTKMYRAVLAAQTAGIRTIRAGVSGAAVHRLVAKTLAAHGFKTTRKGGVPQGFIHSTGHGLGLDVHEPPRIGRKAGALKAGVVVSIEPGLYYKEIGGVRIEDIVCVTRKGCEVLSCYPKRLEIP